MSSLRNPLVTADVVGIGGDGSTEIEQLVCARCQPLEARVAVVEAERVGLITENTMLGNEIDGLQHTLRKQGAEIVALRNELTKVREDDPASDTIRTVLQHWVRVTGREIRKGRKADVSVSGSRGQLVKKALKLQNLETRKHYTPEELCEALTGLGLKPYVGPKGRSAVGEKRYDEVKHALGDEELIDRFIGYARDAANAARTNPEAMWALVHRKAAEHEVVVDLMLGSLEAPAFTAALDHLTEELAA